MPFIMRNTLPKLAASTLAAAVLTAAAMTPAVAASSAPNPAEAYISSVSANGNGCPPGTWEAAISPDGKSFTVTFSSYETLIEPGSDASERECTLSLNVHTPPGSSLSTAKFSYQGYALMDQAGMSATQSASYNFSGAPVPAQSVRSQILGPHDDSYLFSDRILLHDDVASAQGATRALNVETGLVLTNNPAETGSGFFNTSSVDGTLQNGPACTIDRRTATSGQTIVGTSGADVICGSPFADRIAALGGDDVILSLAGNDRISAGAGNDTGFGGTGDDDISGDDGNDTLDGEAGNDRILGGPGTDTANGGPGTDSCVAEVTTSC
ncbi:MULTISPECIES: DUF4360 domain-containing protein [unclassified Nonomuraea]|uniref:DUF4360 domain-containing protein n=1 Tax=unclassified Nonomuraea TaxID=2593643 RepID=UPI0033F7472A